MRSKPGLELAFVTVRVEAAAATRVAQSTNDADPPHTQGVLADLGRSDRRKR